MTTYFARCLAITTVAMTILLWAVPPAVAAQAQSEARDCFPFESLSPELRARAERLLLEVLDSEGLYTIAADIKPMSSGTWSIHALPIYNDRVVCLSGLLILVVGFAIVRWHNVWRRYFTILVAASGVFLLFLGLYRITTNTTRNVDELNQIMRVWKCGGEVSGGLWWYDVVHDDKRPMGMFVFNIPQMAKVVSFHKDFFSTIGISSYSPELDVIKAIERAERGARDRSFGLLYGYPEHAVDFFVDAYRHEQATGEFVERDPIWPPTFRSPMGFAYAVPEGRGRTDADRALADRALPVFYEYVKRRNRHIRGDSGSGVLSLVREWFDDGNGDVRPSNAWLRHDQAANPEKAE